MNPHARTGQGDPRVSTAELVAMLLGPLARVMRMACADLRVEPVVRDGHEQFVGEPPSSPGSFVSPDPVSAGEVLAHRVTNPQGAAAVRDLEPQGPEGRDAPALPAVDRGPRFTASPSSVPVDGGDGAPRSERLASSGHASALPRRRVRVHRRPDSLRRTSASDKVASDPPSPPKPRIRPGGKTVARRVSSTGTALSPSSTSVSSASARPGSSGTVDVRPSGVPLKAATARAAAVVVQPSTTASIDAVHTRPSTTAPAATVRAQPSTSASIATVVAQPSTTTPAAAVVVQPSTTAPTAAVPTQPSTMDANGSAVTRETVLSPGAIHRGPGRDARVVGAAHRSGAGPEPIGGDSVPHRVLVPVIASDAPHPLAPRRPSTAPQLPTPSPGLHLPGTTETTHGSPSTAAASHTSSSTAAGRPGASGDGGHGTAAAESAPTSLTERALTLLIARAARRHGIEP